MIEIKDTPETLPEAPPAYKTADQLPQVPAAYPSEIKDAAWVVMRAHQGQDPSPRPATADRGFYRRGVLEDWCKVVVAAREPQEKIVEGLLAFAVDHRGCEGCPASEGKCYDKRDKGVCKANILAYVKQDVLSIRKQRPSFPPTI